MSTREHIKATVLYMKRLYPNYQPELEGEGNTIDALLTQWGDLSPETLTAAVQSLCSKGGQFAPSAGDVRAEVTRLNFLAAGVPTAGEAWKEVMTHIVDNGCEARPNWSHPLIGQAADAVGLRAIGMSENVMVERAHYLKIYDQLVARAADDVGRLPQVTKYLENIDIKRLTDKLQITAKSVNH